MRTRWAATVSLHAAVLALSLAVAGCGSTLPRAHLAGTVPAGARVAILPFANYSETANASDRVLPALTVELTRQRNVEVVDPGVVEDVVGDEPWLLLDRVPPDVLERFGDELEASGLIVGSVLAYGYRREGGSEVPEFAVSLRLLEVPGGRLLWSVMHARNGAERESVFGIGRVESLDRLVGLGAKEIMATFPTVVEDGTQEDSSS